MKKIGLILLIGIIASCENKREFVPNENLVEFKSWTIMDMDELLELPNEDSRILRSQKFNVKTDTIRFEKDFIYVSCLSVVNGCGNYAGNLEIRNDSIYLKLVDTVGIACTEQRVDRLKYKIRNSENKEYAFAKW